MGRGNYEKYTTWKFIWTDETEALSLKKYTLKRKLNKCKKSHTKANLEFSGVKWGSQEFLPEARELGGSYLQGFRNQRAVDLQWKPDSNKAIPWKL